MILVLTFIFLTINYANELKVSSRENLGEIEFDDINEASGLVASRKNKDVFWTHNDSGDLNRIYAFNNQGKHIGQFYLNNCPERDWEDITLGPGPIKDEQYLYVGNIGDNYSIYDLKYIYRFIEPNLISNQKNVEEEICNCDIITFQYEDGNRDAETLMIDPLTKDIYIISKREKFVHIYQLPFPQDINDIMIAKLIGVKDFYPEIENEGPEMIVAGEISNDGNKIIVKSYIDIFYFRRNFNQTISDALQTEFVPLNYDAEIQGESISWHPLGEGYFTVSEEKLNIPAVLYYYPILIK